VASAGWRRRLRLGGSSRSDPGEGHPDGFIDVRKLMQELGVEGCLEQAEEYFAAVTDWRYHLSKPFFSAHEAPVLLQRFAHLMQGLQLLPRMTVIDFGAGSCWMSRMLTQLDMKVIALDVSQTALNMGQELYRRFPVLGDVPQPEFLLFDGYHIDLPDESVDRVICNDAFHHVPNPEQVLGELARVLKPGGMAGFAEPGPEHSRAAQSQYEMRHYHVVENDMILSEIWEAAKRGGFTSIWVAVFAPPGYVMPATEFEHFVARGWREADFAAATREYMKGQRIFYLRNGEETTPLDSRQPTGLKAALRVGLESRVVVEGRSFRGHASATNTGSAVWLPFSSPRGAVLLGGHLASETGKRIDLDLVRARLTPGEGTPIAPGETVEVDFEIPAPPKGRYIIEFDLVAEGVSWFELNNSEVARILVEVT